MLAVGWRAESSSQQRPQTTPRSQEDVRLGTIGVNLPITVFDKDGRLVTDLTKEDFEVKEDKVVQEIRSFSKENELPLTVSLLMDVSNSVRPKLKFEQEATMAFLDTIVRPRKDKALFVTFASVVELQQDFTDDLEALKTAIYAVKSGGATALYDAVYRSLEEKMTTAAGRRAVIVISDGEDNSSEHTLDEVVDLAQRVEAVIYCIGTNNAGGFGVSGGVHDAPGNKELRKIAEETGGRAYFPSKILELERNFTEISKELRSQYVLFYVSSNQTRDGVFREIDVKVPARKGLEARAKRGYTAPKG
jgi:Ca-activated chloride channel family protein